MKNNIPIFGFIMVILIIVRCSFNSIPQLVLVIAAINLVALLMVLFSITAQIKEQGSNKINRLGPVKHFANRDNKRFCHMLNCVTYIPYTVISIIYLLWFKCALGNDIISIIALCLSLSDQYIVTLIIDYL